METPNRKIYLLVTRDYFNPDHITYIKAAFTTYEKAQEAHEALRRDGFFEARLRIHSVCIDPDIDDFEPGEYDW